MDSLDLEKYNSNKKKSKSQLLPGSLKKNKKFPNANQNCLPTSHSYDLRL